MLSQNESGEGVVRSETRPPTDPAPRAWARTAASAGPGRGHPILALGSVGLVGDEALTQAQAYFLSVEGWGEGIQ